MVFLFAMLFINITGLWGIDISVSAIVTGPDIGITNGWWFRTPLQHYHIGLWMTGLSGFIVILSAVYLLIEKHKI